MNISHILSVEKLRNGGSLIVSFQADDFCEYWLMLPIKVCQGISSGYLPPVLVNRTLDIEVDLSWSVAKSWLHRLERYIDKVDQPLFNTIWNAVDENI
ncbi:hypothetical protein [Pseudoteredinibacter isoporae]|uniref:Uncharacterized protein n=1 Tax=Pseudoteredinibacter isoporae TaxID=570281 RepID=A0A7X0JUA0_9GAMM|nr:hypothetical protein [Pseudoteredinibacter isoporae]MBB6522277.1 hypothetical protein [Pseudoteredinibacter isoporae]NHO87810.1 hypothetical protein [Pseudoteredinibacter isoporae]NIB23859.1 hypothetical protein [Pseudoteredinibacter isoporae]